MTTGRPAPSPRLRRRWWSLHPGDVVAAVRRPRTLKHGDTFGVFDHYGDMVPAGSPEGIYHQDTRYLSGLQLLINGRRPLLLSSIVQDNNALLTADLTNPDFSMRPGACVWRRTRSISCARSSSGRRGSMNAWPCVTSTIAAAIRLTWQFQTDFADLFEVRGHQRAARGRTSAAIHGRHAITFTYDGLAGDVSRTIDARANRLEVGEAVFELSLSRIRVSRCSASLNVTAVA